MKKSNPTIWKVVMAVSILMLMGTFCGMYIYQKMDVSCYLLEAIGRVYEQSPENTMDFLNALFVDKEEGNYATLGREALKEHGFTSDGIYYIVDAAREGIGYVLLGLLQLVAGTVLVVICISAQRRESVLRAEYERLSKKIDESVYRERFAKEQNQKTLNFIENVAHQIKTPISRINTTLDIVSEDMAGESKERIEECFLHTETINMLMKRLMDIGRLEAGKIIFKREQCNLVELLGELSGERVQSNLATEKMEYYGDYEWLKEAFSNIIVNAKEHDLSGLPLEICCKKEPEYFFITIRDHGPGIAREDIGHIFDRFYQPRDAKNGHVGIGLNLARMIIEGHYGNICVSNCEDGGAMFTVMLPLYQLKGVKV